MREEVEISDDADAVLLALCKVTGLGKGRMLECALEFAGDALLGNGNQALIKAIIAAKTGARNTIAILQDQLELTSRK